MIADTVEEGKIGRAMAIISIQLNLGLSLGPLLGGIVYATVGWFGVFALGFSFLALDIIMRMIMIEKRVAISFRSSSNLTQEKSLSPEGEGKCSTSRTSGKIPEVFRLLRYPRMMAGMWLALTQATIISAFDAALPLHVNRLFGWTSSQAGIIPIDFLTLRFNVSCNRRSTVFHCTAFRMDVRSIWTQTPFALRDRAYDPIIAPTSTSSWYW